MLQVILKVILIAAIIPNSNVIEINSGEEPIQGNLCCCGCSLEITKVSLIPWKLRYV